METTTIIGLDLENRAGVLGEAAKALATRDVGVRGFSLETGESLKRAHLVPDDVEQALEALATVGVGRHVQKALLLPASEDSREMRRLGEKLADAEVDVETSFLVANGSGRPQLALAVEEPRQAERALAAEFEARLA